MNDPHIEQGVIDSFRRLMVAYGVFKAATWESFAVGGQDRTTASDYIFTDSTEFCLIEFKDRRDLLGTEGKKSVASRLCNHLETNSDMLALSRKCHHIAWEENGDIRSAPYPEVVCCKKHFSELSLSADKPSFNNERDSDTFCKCFSEPPPHVKIKQDEFEKYLEFLMNLSEKSATDLVVIADNIGWPDADRSSSGPPRMVVKRLKGFEAIKQWIDRKQPQSNPGNPFKFR